MARIPFRYSKPLRGSFGSSRSGTLAILLDLVYVMLASGYILLAHSSLGPTAVPTRRAPTEVPAA